MAVDYTVLVPLGDVAAIQNQATEETMSKLVSLLNYVASNPNASVTYVASYMCLHINSDASYLSAPKVRSRTGAHYVLSLHPRKNMALGLQLLNRPVHVVSNFIKFVMASVAEAAIGANFIAAQGGLPIIV